jgi:hypothetical protein
MAILSVTQLTLDLSLNENDSVDLERYLLHVTQAYASVLYRQSVEVQISHYSGSWKAVIKVAGSIYLSFSFYGDFRSSLDWLIKDASSIKSYIHETLAKDGVPDHRIAEVKRRECTTDRIRRVFKRIDRYRDNALDSRDEASLERDKILICNMISRILRAELEHEQDRSLFIQSLDGEYRSYIEDVMGISAQPLGSSLRGGSRFLAESQRPNILALEPSASFATLEPRADFETPHPPAILNAIP